MNLMVSNFYLYYTTASPFRIGGWCCYVPKKRGRFIPCRGGGTATTYYTDAHDVDEDRMVISGQGAIWFGIGIHVGVMCRVLNASPGDISDGVASRLIYLS